MQTWLSYHIYPLETPEVFLARAVRPFLEKYIWPTAGTRAFFIRYADDKGPHIRLRMRGEDEWLQEVLLPAFAEHFSGRGDIDLARYLPETERFGGEAAMNWAEEHFHLSTRVVLDRLNRPYTYGDALFDAMRMHAITTFAAGWTREKSAWYFDRLCDQWLTLFFQPAESNENSPGAPKASGEWRETLKAEFEENYAPQGEDLRLAMTQLWAALEKGKFDTGQPEWLRWLRGNQMILAEFGNDLEKALPSLIHLTNNRLGLNNQDEVYLNYLLARAV
jgi:thiopeptide-type bacteriocin biosynthesis protein